MFVALKWAQKMIKFIMNKQSYNEGIARYLKKTLKKYPNFLEEPSKVSVSIIKNIYREMDEFYLPNIHNKKPLDSSQQKTFDKIYSEPLAEEIALNKGGFLYLRNEDVLVSVVELSFVKIYPSIIRLLNLTGKLGKDFDMFSYLVENIDDIKSYLTPEETQVFTIIVNYRYGIMENRHIVTLFCRKMMQDILDMDTKLDICYIDTDTIYYYDNDELYQKIMNYINGLFKLEKKEPMTYLFCNKKKYVCFYDMKSVKIHGLGYTRHFKDKDIKNLAYDLYCERCENPVSYLPFHATSRVFSTNTEYMVEARQIISRRKKLKRILNK